MELKEYTVSYGRKIQLDQFEPVEVYESVTVTLEEGDELADVSRELGQTVRKNAERNLMKRVMAKKMNEEGEDGD
jgi:hypothetical protein